MIDIQESHQTDPWSLLQPGLFFSETTLPVVTVTLPILEDLMNEILAALRGRGFRRETPSRLELMQKINQIQVETVDIRKELKRLRLIRGGEDADK